MGILTREEILKKIDSREIVIEPFNEGAVGPASVDFHLGEELRIFKNIGVVNQIKVPEDYKEITEEVLIKDNYILHPGQLVLGVTKEKLTLPGNLCAFIEGRSTLGRLGLAVHITAGFIQPGVSNHQVLEMQNSGPIPLVLNAGIAICQIIFMTTEGEAFYKGKFQGQEKP